VPDPEREPFFRLLPAAPDDPEGATRVLATASTAGPWFPDGQHMGPPSALLVRALEQCEPRDEVRLARLTVEVLGRVPMGELTVHAAVERAGRTIELVGAELRAQGRAVARAHGWRLAIGDTAAAATPPTPALDPPDAGRAIPTPPGWLPGYLDALEWRWLHGHLGESGPGAAWARLRVPVVEGEEPTPWQRLAAVADSTNGAAARLDLTAWLFVNTDLTLHVHRAPEGEWIGLDADSVIGPDGAGTAFSLLHDRHGPVGRAAQALTVRPR
jgi:hypothetical protein